MEKIKNSLVKFYRRNGKRVSKFMLISCVIAMAFFALLTIATGTDITFGGVVEILIATPVVSILVMLMRLSIWIVRRVVSERLILVRLGLYLLALAVITTAPSFLLKDVPVSDSNVIQVLIFVLFDLIYATIVVAGFLAERFNKTYEI